jgi:UDPglucose--hexose-1-phosphate uridylyltransferase
MFSVNEIATSKGTLQYREEHYTGIRCRISPDRLKRQIGQSAYTPPDSVDCPFCRDVVFSVTPTFPDGNRIVRGESVTFPNLYPFGEGHIVTVLTCEHFPGIFTRKQIIDGLFSQIEALRRFNGFASINWNYLPSAGASLVHPHMQGLSDQWPSRIVERYLLAGRRYRLKHNRNYWFSLQEAEKISDRYLFGDEITWTANAVPIGEREVRGILPISTLDEMECYVDLLARGILEILDLYKKLGTSAFNMSIFFDKAGNSQDFHAFCSIISRINPNALSTSDTAFMERLHLEPIIMTFPEDLGTFYKKEKK